MRKNRAVRRLLTAVLIGIVAVGSLTLPELPASIVRADDAVCQTLNLDQNNAALDNKISQAQTAYDTWLAGDDSQAEQNIRAFSEKLGAAQAEMSQFKDFLIQYAANNCPQDAFERNKGEFISSIPQYNTLVDHYNGIQLFKVGLPATYPEFDEPHNLVYSQLANPAVAVCQTTISEAERNATAATTLIDNARTQVNNGGLTMPDDIAQNVRETLSQAKDRLVELHRQLNTAAEQHCDQGTTANTYRTLRTRLDDMLAEGSRLDEVLSNRANGWISIGWNGISNSLGGSQGDCGCTNTGTNTGLGALNISICLSLCGLSKAIGSLACVIIGQVIDPLFAGGKNKTCKGGTPTGRGGGGNGAEGPGPRPTGSTNPVSGTAQQLAQGILNNGNVTLYGASLPAVQAAANGQSANGTNLDQKLLGAIASISNSYSIRITALSNGGHSARSYHYSGRAVDIDMINGIQVADDRSQNYHERVRQLCLQLGAVEAFGPSNDPDGNHWHHVHCAF